MSADEIKTFFSTYSDIFTNEQSKIDFLNFGFQDQQNALFYSEVAAINNAYSAEGLEDYKQNIINAQSAIEDLKNQYIQKQAQLLNLMGSDADTEEVRNEIDKYAALINSYDIQIDAYADQLKHSAEYFQSLGETERQNLIASQLSGIDNLDDLDTTLGKITSAGLDIPINQLADALTNVAEKYKNTTVEIQNYHDAVLNGNTESILAAEDALRAATRIGEAAEKYGLSAESLEIQAKQIKAANKEMEILILGEKLQKQQIINHKNMLILQQK